MYDALMQHSSYVRDMQEDALTVCNERRGGVCHRVARTANAQERAASSTRIRDIIVKMAQQRGSLGHPCRLGNVILNTAWDAIEPVISRMLKHHINRTASSHQGISL